ncbi:hypothetical protein PYJP_04760 [Pyrofollis japonicus]|nr:hypothetical protein PYJP_04760 [Pyrofollis japonicus]
MYEQLITLLVLLGCKGHAMGKVRDWNQEKLEAWQRLWEDLEIGYLDTDILDVLVEFFLRPKAFTKSSCSGRITVIDADYPWSKEETATIFKKHEPVKSVEIERLLKVPRSTRLWLSVQGPIYHVYVRDFEEAKVILEAAREAGFKHSGIMVLGYPMLVELRTGVRADILLADKQEVLIKEERIEDIVSIANDVLAQAKERNRRLLRALRERRPQELWQPAREKAKQLGLL